MPTVLESLLRQAAERLPAPSRAATQQARRAALAAYDESRAGTPAPFGSGRLRNGPPLRALAVAAALLAVGALAALALTPGGGQAGPRVTAPAAPGFLPSAGWTILTTAPAGPHGAAAAIASNVPLRDEITPSATLPYRTIAKLPPDGIVVVASFRPRGQDARLDARYPVRELPFTVLDAPLTWPDTAAPGEPVTTYVRGAAAGYNVHVSIHVGGPLTEGLLAEAQDQLGRLVVPPLLLRARRAVASGPGAVWARPAELFGSVAGGEGEHDVVLQMRECETGFYRDLEHLHPDAKGRFEVEVEPPITTTYRVAWGGATSRPVTVRARPGISLRHVDGAVYEYTVLAQRDLGGARLTVERFEPSTRRWIPVHVQRVAPADRGGGLLASRGRFEAPLPPGTALRAKVPDSETGVCYAAGFSNVLNAP